MKTVKRPLGFDALEARELLSTMAFRPHMRSHAAEVRPFHQPRRIAALHPASIGYRSPVVKARAMSVAVATPPTTPPKIPTPPTAAAPTQSDLNLAVASPSINSIGGGVHIVILDQNPNWKMLHVTISASGALSSQLFDTNHGSYTRFYPTSYNPPGGTDYYGAYLYWDENPGMRNVTVTAQYDDPAHTTLTATMLIPVDKPTVDHTILTGSAVRLGDMPLAPPGTSIGLTLLTPAGTPGVLFDSLVLSTPSGGEFGFVQIATHSRSTWTYAHKQKVEEAVGAGPFLDSYPGAANPAMQERWTSLLYATTNPLPLPTAYDAPGIGVDGIGATIDPTTAVFGLDKYLTLETYLVWHPSGGGYVAVDHVRWSVIESATYNGSRDATNFKANYMNPANWTFTSNHTGPWSVTGDKSVSLLEWSDNLPHATVTTINDI